jgi:hypothetical protein
MTEQTPRPREQQGEKRPRDAAYWAQRVETLRVSNVPEGVANINVEGRRVVGPLQGFGQFWQKPYKVRLAGAEATPKEVVRIWKDDSPTPIRRRAGSTRRWEGWHPGRSCSSTPRCRVCRCTLV